MSWFRLVFSALIFASGMIFSHQALAKNIFVVVGSRVVVYSGPGTFYRPLTVLATGAQMAYAPTPVKNKGEEFYRVLVRLSDNRKAIGFIRTDAEVRRKEDTENPEELESFKDYPLAERSIQGGYAMLRDQRSQATLGLIKFVGPGFYLSGFGGALMDQKNSSPFVAGGFGNDANFFGRVSGYISFALGVFLTPEPGALFEGSKDDFSNFLVQTAIGIRYNFGEIAAISIGATQMTAFSPNNSLVTNGGLIQLEWGL